MESVLDLYTEPYDADYPMVCMDEMNKQLVKEVKEPIPPRLGIPQRYDTEYIRNGTCNLFIFFEPLKGWRHIEVTDRRTAVDWAHQIKILLDDYYPKAKKVRLVMDNLNIHSITSLYKAFKPQEARRLAKRLELHYTPKHGSWLNMAEIELSHLSRQCLKRRIPDQETIKREVAAWVKYRNDRSSKMKWRFTTEDARIKLKFLYPTL